MPGVEELLGPAQTELFSRSSDLNLEGLDSHATLLILLRFLEEMKSNILLLDSKLDAVLSLITYSGDNILKHCVKEGRRGDARGEEGNYLSAHCNASISDGEGVTGTETGADGGASRSSSPSAPTSSVKKVFSYPKLFEEFWQACHPKMRVGKKMAHSAWESARRRGHTPEALLAALRMQLRTEKFRKGYVTTAKKWLEEDRLLDDPASMGPMIPDRRSDLPDASSLDLPEF